MEHVCNVPEGNEWHVGNVHYDELDEAEMDQVISMYDQAGRPINERGFKL